MFFHYFCAIFWVGKKSWNKIDSGSVDEAFWRDFSCGNTWFWNEKEWFFSRFFNPLVYKERDFLFFFYTFFRVKKCMNTKLVYSIWIAILPQKKWSKKACFWLLSMNLKIAKILNEVCIFDDFLWWSMLNFEKVKNEAPVVLWPGYP